MQQLSAQDAFFLHIESPKTPMHIGAIYIASFDDPKQTFDFDAMKEMIRSRLHLSKVFRRRLIEAPLDSVKPFWIEDPDFNLDAHMFHVALPKPSNMRGLAKLAAQIYNYPLDRNRPLWKLTFITGLEGLEGIPPNSFAVVVQVHHANIDGMSGAEMMVAIFDWTVQPRDVPSPKKEWKPQSIPTTLEIIKKGYKGVAGNTPVKLMKFLANTAGKFLDIAKEAAATLAPPPPMPMTAPDSILNVPVSANKTFGAVDIPLSQIKKVKNLINGKVNDVVLAICSGALRRYLKERKKLPRKPLVAMAPISVRSKDEKGDMGNRISAMLVGLATNIADPIKRVKKIRENATGSKLYGKANSVDEIMEFIPSEVAALAGRLYTRMSISKLHRPFFNVVITNVPGPPMPLYLNGARIINHYGLGITFDGVGLMIVVFSYAGVLSICATSTEEIMPDVSKFAQYIRQSLHELEELLEKDAAEKEKKAAKLAKKAAKKKKTVDKKATAKKTAPKVVKPKIAKVAPKKATTKPVAKKTTATKIAKPKVTKAVSKKTAIKPAAKKTTAPKIAKTKVSEATPKRRTKPTITPRKSAATRGTKITTVAKKTSNGKTVNGQHTYLKKGTFNNLHHGYWRSEKNKEFYFHFKNGDQTILNSEGYSRKSNCENGINSVKKHAGIDKYYELKKSRSGKYFFNLKARNTKIIGTSPMFATEALRNAAIELLKTGKTTKNGKTTSNTKAKTKTVTRRRTVKR